MTHTEVLREIEARGLSITAAGADLRLQGPRERMDAALIGLIRAHKAELVAHLSTPAGFPLTDLQRAYLVGRDEAFEIGGVASHVYHEIDGCWDVDRLEAALRAVVARHGILRTRFTAEGRQVQEERVDVRVERLDLRGQPEAAQDACRMALREQRSHRLLPLDRAPLLAVEATILAGDRMVLHVSHDGLVLDAVSMFLFFRDWWAAYEGGPAPGSDEAEAPFEAYVAALDAARARAPTQRARAYWLDRLDDVAPHPDLPLAASPATIARPRFTASFVRLDVRTWADLRARAAAAGLTSSGLLFAAYAETLARWGAGSRFTINATVANRPPIHPRILGALGNFGETMLVEVALDRRAGFADRARALQAQLRRSLDNRHVSGIEVMRELGRRRGAAEARMPYTFNSALGYPGGIDGSALELFGSEVHTSSQTPQVWLDVTAFEQQGGVVVEFDSVDGLHPDGLVEALVGGYRRLLEALLDGAAWSATTFDLLPAEQRERRRAANDTAAALAPEPALLHEGFQARAELQPDAPAIVTTAGTTTYAELRRRAMHAAAWLRDQGIGRDELVGLVMRRGPEQLAGILATVIAGAAYLPVDAALPEERQALLLADGRVRCVLTNVALPPSIACGRGVLALDAGRPLEAGPADDVPPAPGAGPDDLAYVLYTSGTTGVPKGVMVSHKSVANVVADCNRRFRLGPGDRFFGISAFNFDLSVYDVFGALSAGAAIVLPDADGTADPAHWLQRCGEARVTVWNSVPAIAALLCDQARADGASALAALRLVMMSGDRIPPALPARLRALKPDLELISLGGPTETTIWNVLHPIGADEDGTRNIPYGRPNANNRASILDADGCDAPDWVPGEILAAGVGLARGYWCDARLTAERFRPDPSGHGERRYRTGDLGRYLPGGEIDILGRTDFQIKLNGYRIEAGEIEARLGALDDVEQAVVVRQGGRLVAHLVAAGSTRPSDAAVREALRRQLPEVMVPSAIAWHDALPLTRNGKVDRAKLSAAAPARPVPAAPAAASSELEREVADIWARMLKTPGVDVTASLYDLGGDSLVAARILTAVRKQFGITITLERLAEVETVRAMAAQIDVARARAEGRR